MDPSPKQPEENKREEDQGVQTASQWLKEQILVAQETSISSIGEFLLPTLIRTMEVCWIAAVLLGLASDGLFGSTEPLLPLWAPFILIVGSIWLSNFLGQRAP